MLVYPAGLDVSSTHLRFLAAITTLIHTNHSESEKAPAADSRFGSSNTGRIVREAFTYGVPFVRRQARAHEIPIPLHHKGTPTFRRAQHPTPPVDQGSEQPRFLQQLLDPGTTQFP